jgi:hypothetical protein
MPPAEAEIFLERLRSLFGTMDEAYRLAASSHGFVCNGCEDSCCRTRFHHHTLLEYLYLREGFRQLPAGHQVEVRARAAAFERASPAGGPERPMCPLNLQGRCLAYAHRPMICRLHGIPHELTLPGRPPQQGPGCDAFNRSCGRNPGPALDRTPLYAELARLESEFRKALGLPYRIRMTVAEMLLEDRVIP